MAAHTWTAGRWLQAETRPAELTLFWRFQMATMTMLRIDTCNKRVQNCLVMKRCRLFGAHAMQAREVPYGRSH